VSAATARALSHRERLLDAMGQSIEERGYRETFVTDVVRIARTSRRNFYENFADREACFLAVFDWAHEEMMAAVAAAASPDQPWERQVDKALDAWLGVLSTRPKLWWSFARELPALGAEGTARQRTGITRFADLLVALVESGRRKQPRLGVRALTRDQAIIIVGGLRELIISATEEGRDIRELRPAAAETIVAILGAVMVGGRGGQRGAEYA
jgi:AcrR family transcriptional regulator